MGLDCMVLPGTRCPNRVIRVGVACSGCPRMAAEIVAAFAEALDR
jgi:Ni,Fe-hydrogenase III small subunit